jgi:hypothetical protein
VNVSPRGSIAALAAPAHVAVILRSMRYQCTRLEKMSKVAKMASLILIPSRQK